jgi:hypothetical protein
MKVLAREGVTVSYYGPDGVRVHHKRITNEGLIDNLTGRVTTGPVEVPEDDFYFRRIAAGSLVRVEE